MGAHHRRDHRHPGRDLPRAVRGRGARLAEPRRAALLAGAGAVVLGGWFSASAVIAGHGWYQTRLGHGVPWLPVAVTGFLGLLLALRQIPTVARP